MNLGGRLRYARESRGLEQKDLAQLVPAASQQFISALETRDSETTTLLFELAEALRVNPRWLQTGKGDSWLDHSAPVVELVAKTPQQVHILRVMERMSVQQTDVLVKISDSLVEPPALPASNAATGS